MLANMRIVLWSFLFLALVVTLVMRETHADRRGG